MIFSIRRTALYKIEFIFYIFYYGNSIGLLYYYYYYTIRLIQCYGLQNLNLEKLVIIFILYIFYIYIIYTMNTDCTDNRIRSLRLTTFDRLEIR